ncbi:TetR/AcrR family transcriptional regulator [Marinobacterium mangrovicola]|uniref:TetR family transcriptional regulator n=1 Tax=Marinobacterium mangrovicola TaxID=1476959 RepID=A0A4R1GNP2_9GAMM|nr:TetR/AcrR family transcriptional regulator [Marinobacterium mangrovicola]TCK08870.1 TetR family transcriptional regulator [Marinobacterium mangrovicola]
MKGQLKDANTATRIILAAEQLFAERGFAETTMRQITAAADVNLAAVNYHYGSKHGLIEAVATRFLDPLCARLEQLLAERRASGTEFIGVEELIEILMVALLEAREDREHSLSLFMHLLDLAYAPDQESLRKFLMQHYAGRIEPMVTLVRQDAAPMENDEFFWRLHFLLGALIFTLSNYSTLNLLNARNSDGRVDIERTLHRMVPVLTAGFHARSEKNWVCRI